MFQDICSMFNEVHKKKLCLTALLSQRERLCHKEGSSCRGGGGLHVVVLWTSTTND